MPPKRKFLTLVERVKVIELNNKNRSARKIAEDFGVGKTQVQNILKRKAEVLEEYENNISGARKRLCRTSENDEINELCLKWFQDATKRRVLVSGPLIQQQALKFARDLNNDTFKASNGWLDSFLKRNNIVFRTMTGERGDVDKTTVDDWKKKLPALCEGYRPEDIFNMDETGLFFRETTNKSFHTKGEDCAGGKQSKERITLALTASMTGEKLKPLVIGKAQKPRCFAKICPENLPVTYRNNKKAWMTGLLMTEWLTSLDRKMKQQKRKIILFLDNAPSHPSVKLDNVKLVFLPSNTTSFTQPMDQGIIQTLKLKYRKRQLQYVLAQLERTEKSGPQILKEISILDAIYWVARAWEEVEASTIQRCFARCGFSLETSTQNQAPDSSEIDEDDIPLAVLRMSKELFGHEFTELAKTDSHIQTSDTTVIEWDKPGSAKEILRCMHEERDDAVSDVDEEGEVEQKTPVCSLMDAEDYVSKLKQFAATVGECGILSKVMELEEMFVVTRVNAASKQTTIKDFFSEPQ